MSTSIMNTYDLFSGNDLKVAEKIQQRRLQLLVHSCIYYHLNTNIISDMQWDKWAKELVQLQKTYPDISEKVWLSTEFKNWDVSTGAFLPITESWVIEKAQRIAGKRYQEKKFTPKIEIKQKPIKKRLF